MNIRFKIRFKHGNTTTTYFIAHSWPYALFLSTRFPLFQSCQMVALTLRRKSLLYVQYYEQKESNISPKDAHDSKARGRSENHIKIMQESHTIPQEKEAQRNFTMGLDTWAPIVTLPMFSWKIWTGEGQLQRQTAKQRETNCSDASCPDPVFLGLRKHILQSTFPATLQFYQPLLLKTAWWAPSLNTVPAWKNREGDESLALFIALQLSPFFASLCWNSCADAFNTGFSLALSLCLCLFPPPRFYGAEISMKRKHIMGITAEDRNVDYIDGGIFCTPPILDWGFNAAVSLMTLFPFLHLTPFFLHALPRGYN